MLPDALKDFNFEEFLFRWRFYFLLILIGLILVGVGVLVTKKEGMVSGTKIEVLEGPTGGEKGKENLVVDISGEIEKPGVYKLPFGSRIEDVLIASGGISKDADRVWVEKNLNRAAKLSDGQKIYIPHSGVLSARNSGQYQNTSSNNDGQGSGLVNVNTASQKELEELPDIAQARAQNIIEHRPYSTVEELLSKGALTKSVYEKIKDKITIY
ncbi:hypothetical protein A2210_00730 [Candidatus Woesebacteria bacterium RIFOXYA1_FULL_40_18]|uniref:Soluble ligand binding domain-containing protein n=2 Tax=Candidatus Woeseibacteriota TaxID=1752722 RepID=A0A1F8CLQ7_9BACT|nr:MAG: hypothetical protein A2210_00730 [Candidatus Woesebacteria bacterium RIFOXYA1_FULL_40_18]OGM81352.1 MAG: hypothetical protein A2361_01620 [Candidatus Woesebacteria bacterium RIFOXYB1_FULL_40_26]